MKHFLALLTALCMALLPLTVQAESGPFATPTPLPGYALKTSDTPLIVFAAKSLKANIAGTISAETAAQVHLLAIEGEWGYISFPATFGTGYGYLPLSYFEALPAPTGTPAEESIVDAGTPAWILNSGEGYRVNLRKEPDGTAKSLGKYYTGTPLTLTGKLENGFAQVLLDGLLGWLDLRFLTQDAEAFVPEMPVVTVDNQGSGANLRSGPSTEHSRLSWYDAGTQVTVMGIRADGWYHVLVGSISGYMSESVLSGAFPWQYGTDSDDPLLHDNMADGSATMYINTRSSGGQLNLRRDASTSSKSLGLFYTGTPVTILSYTRTGWAYVRIGHIEGYMDADYLTTAKPTQLGQGRVIRNSQADGLNLRSLPSTGGEVLAFLPNYTRVTVLGELADGWCYVLWGNVYGYMLGTGLKKDK